MHERYIPTMVEKHTPTMVERHIPTRVYLRMKDTHQGVPTDEGYPPWYSLVYTHHGIAWYIHHLVYPPPYTPGYTPHLPGSVPTSVVQTVLRRRVPGLCSEINNREERLREALAPKGVRKERPLCAELLRSSSVIPG